MIRLQACRSLIGRLSRRHFAAFLAVTADFRAGNRNLDTAVARNLLLQFLVERAFDFANLPAAQAGNVDMIAWPVRFVEMAVAAEVQQVEFVNQALALEHLKRPVDSYARDVFVELLRALEDFVRVEMARRAFDHLNEHAALPRKPYAALAKLALEAAGRLMSVDPLAG
jgi:hypothetical protein